MAQAGMLSIEFDPDPLLKEMSNHNIAVWLLINKFCKLLSSRGVNHDKSMLDNKIELSGWLEYGRPLKYLTYGTDDYKAAMEFLRPTIEMHYRANRHHPEHFADGMNGMNLIDLIEMFCDWMAATKRHNDGDIFRSIRINKERFGYSDMLESIFKNTAELLIKNKNA